MQDHFLSLENCRGKDTVMDEGLTLREAAMRLGASEVAIRKLVARGTFLSELGADGLRYVYLNGRVMKGQTHPPPVSPKHSGLRGRHSLSAKDRIIAILENQLAEERG